MPLSLGPMAANSLSSLASSSLPLSACCACATPAKRLSGPAKSLRRWLLPHDPQKSVSSGIELVNLFPRFRNGACVTDTLVVPSFDLAVATRHLAERDECLKRLIAETLPFQMDQDPLQSPYEALLEAIAYQSISGKAAATIFGRIKALSTTD